MIDLANLPSSPFKSLNYFNEQLMINWGNSSRERLSLSLFIIEIDNFKSLSKTYDNADIDNIIFGVSNALNSILHRESDFLSQVSSHCLMFLATEMDYKQAILFAEKFHQTIANFEVPQQDSMTSSLVTVSIGHVSCIPEANNCEGPQTFIKSARKHLKKAIKSGGNCSRTSLEF
jgi:diguanylate cyclase (GGDEF)-like protein